MDAHFTEPYAALTLARALGVLPAEIIDERQRAALERYTRHHLQLANETQ